MDTLGTILKNLREKKDLQQKDLALILNVHKGSISNWETDKRTPDKDMLIKIADYFDVTLDYLLGRTSNKKSKIYKTKLDNHSYTIELDKGIETEITQEELREMIKKLKAVGFDVNKLLEKENDSN